MDRDRGLDEASYFAALAPVTVNLSTNSATGQGNDTLSSIERATGSPLGDHLTGSNLANILRGGNGNDTLAGLDGNDQLLGEGGNDSMNGGAGTDPCVQGSGTGAKTSCEL